MIALGSHATLELNGSNGRDSDKVILGARHERAECRVAFAIKIVLPFKRLERTNVPRCEEEGRQYSPRSELRPTERQLRFSDKPPLIELVADVAEQLLSRSSLSGV